MKMRTTVAFGLALVVLLMGEAAASAQDVIGADRPGLDFNPGTVAPGVVQIEVGLSSVTFDEGPGDDTRLWQSPTLIRVGLVPAVEVRAQVSPFNSLSAGSVAEGVGEGAQRGFGDFEIGAKIRLSDSGGGPRIAVIPSITVPTGDEPFTSDGVGYLLNAVLSQPIGEASALAAVAGLYRTRAGEARYETSGLLALVASRSLSDRLGGFVEVGWSPTAGPSDPVVVGGGVALLVSSEVQLDLFVDRGVSDGAPAWQLGGGVAFRL